MAGTTSGWGGSTTYAYFGQIYLDGSTYNFAESIDDAVFLKIDGSVVIDNASWNTTSTGSITREAGWYDFDLRVYNGSGGAGPTNADGWGTTAYGFGYNTSGYAGKAAGNYTFPVEPGDLTLFRYDDGLGFDDALSVSAFPRQYPVGEDIYRTYSGLDAGDTLELSIPGAYTNDLCDTIAVCTGWKLLDDEERVVATGTGSALSYTHPDPIAYRSLVWQWEPSYKITAASASGGTVDKTEEWVVDGGFFTAVATPAAGGSFYRWRDGDGNTVSLSSSLSLRITAPVELTAEFAGVYYVDPENGDDAADGSLSSPFKGLEVACERVPDGSTVLLFDGIHTITNRQIELSRPVIIRSINGPDRCTVKGAWAGANASNTRGGGVFHITNPSVLLEGVTITGGNRYNYKPGAGAIYMTGGFVTNCVVRDNVGGADGSGNAGAIRIEGGTITGCRIFGNKATYNNNGLGIGAGVWMSGGLVENCVISNNFSGNQGAGVYISGTGILRNSLVAENHGIGSATTMNQQGGGIYIAGGTADRCVVRSNYANSGAGVYLKGGTLLNSLVYGNHGNYAGAGVINAGGTVVNCTVAANTAMATLAGTGFSQTSGTTRNTVIYGNPCGAAGDAVVSGGTFDHNFTMLPLDGFAENQHGSVFFRDAANYDFRLLAGSKAIDGALPFDGVESDITGVARPSGAAPDMGCYEYVAGQGSLTCTFNASGNTRFLNSGEAAFAASVDGAELEGLRYAWYFDGVLQSETGSSISWPSIGLGSHSVKLVVSNSAGEVAECEVEGIVKVTTDHVYANENGSDEYPYDTPAKGARKLQDALDAVWIPSSGIAKVTVMAGKYCPYSKWFVIDKPIRLESVEGPSSTHLYAYDPNSPSYEGGKIRRVLYVNNPNAVVSGFTLSNGWWYASAGDSGPGGIRIASGTVTNCVITRNRGGDLGGGVQMSGGLLTDCEIFDNYARYNNDGCNTRGGGVYMTGGTIERCRIYRNWAANNGDTGSGVWMNGGTLRDTEIFSNFSRTTGMKGIGLYIAGGLAERCIISNNNQSAKMIFPNSSSIITYNAGGVYQKGGTVRNCLISGNRAQKTAAGYLQEGGTSEFNTLTANVSDDKSGSGLHINGAQAVARYNILYGNGAGLDAEPDCNLKYSSAKTFAMNVLGHATQYGTDNIYADPLFVNPAASDYTLGAGSPAIDIVPAEDAVECDLLGNIRPEDGDGDGASLADAGCFEAPDASSGPLSCAFSPTEATGHDEVTVTFTASVTGTGSDGTLNYSWDVGSGEIISGADSPVVTVKFSEYGVHPVSLSVSAASGGQAEKSIADCVRVGSARIYIDAASTTAAWPFATPATASSNLEEAVSSAVLSSDKTVEYLLAEGDYRLTEKWILFNSPTWLHGTGDKEKTRIIASPQLTSERKAKVLCMAHPGVVVECVTLTGGCWEGNSFGDDGGAVRISAGTLRDSVLVNNRGGNFGGQLDMSGGLVSGVVISNGQSIAVFNVGNGRGTVYITGGTLENSLIVGNTARNSAGGIYISGGMVSNCVIRANQSGYNGCADRPGGGVWVAGGILTHSVITGNCSYGNYGGVYQTGGKVENCLISGNWSPSTVYQGIGIDNGSFVNNTVVSNGFNGTALSPVVASMKNGKIVNSIFASNVSDLVSATGGTISYSRFAGATGEGNISSDPCFRNAAGGDWRLNPGSPCIDTGDFAALGDKQSVRAKKDITGGRRFVRSGIDMGCYENQSAGTALIMR